MGWNFLPPGDKIAEENKALTFLVRKRLYGPGGKPLPHFVSFCKGAGCLGLRYWRSAK